MAGGRSSASQHARYKRNDISVVSFFLREEFHDSVHIKLKVKRHLQIYFDLQKSKDGGDQKEDQCARKNLLVLVVPFLSLFLKLLFLLNAFS